MNNSIKKLITTFGVMFLILGGIALGQTQPGQISQPSDKGNKCTQTNGDRIGSDGSTAIGICNCPTGYKWVDDQGCVDCSAEGVCCGIELNTDVPFIGNCIELSNGSEENTDNSETRVTEQTAFPILMGGLTKMLVTIIMLVSFVAILVGGVMIASSGGSDSGASNGKKLIGRVIVALALLGASGVILRLINPNFFG